MYRDRELARLILDEGLRPTLPASKLEEDRRMPAVNALLKQCLSHVPQERPDVATVFNTLSELLGSAERLDAAPKHQSGATLLSTIDLKVSLPKPEEVGTPKRLPLFDQQRWTCVQCSTKNFGSGLCAAPECRVARPSANVSVLLATAHHVYIGLRNGTVTLRSSSL